MTAPEPCENCGTTVVHGSRFDLKLDRKRGGLDVIHGPFDTTARLWDRADFISAEEAADLLDDPAADAAYRWHHHTPSRCQSARRQEGTR